MVQPDLKNSLVPGTVLLVGLACAAALLAGDLSEDAIRLAVRLTAGTSFGLLLAAFCVRPLYQLTGRPLLRPLLRSRRQLGISVAISHSYHLLMLLLLALGPFGGDFGKLGSLSDNASGIVIYALLYAMAFTSNDAAVRRLGRAWRILHRLGIYLLVIAFSSLYLEAALELGGHYWWYAGTGLAALALRPLAWLRNRRQVEPKPAGDGIR
jgi:DMSO/TMAO reductase YedYZ heme-binding membrane subunit